MSPNTGAVQLRAIPARRNRHRRAGFVSSRVDGQILPPVLYGGQDLFQVEFLRWVTPWWRFDGGGL